MRPYNNLENKIPSDTFKSSARMHKSSGSQFFRATTKMQSGPDDFWQMKVVYDLHNQIESYIYIMLFQISSRREKS